MKGIQSRSNRESYMILELFVEADEEPHKLELLTDGGHSATALSSLVDRITTRIQQGLAQAVVQLKEFVMSIQGEHRPTGVGNSGTQSDNRELTGTTHVQSLGIKDSGSDSGSAGHVLETANQIDEE